MSAETKFNLAEKFFQNWQSRFPNYARCDNRTHHNNILRHNNTVEIGNEEEIQNNNITVIDDSLTNLNWLQNLNLFSLPQCEAPLSPLPDTYFQAQNVITNKIGTSVESPGRFSHPFLESNSLYAEVAQNLEFINEEASSHFFKVNNQLRPPFSDINLISMAIYSYNKSKVSFPEICQWIEETFPYYKIINQDWKVGIKNNLTISKCFHKVPRRKNDIEKGGFWRFSNDFLCYLERNRSMKNNFSDIVINVQQENANQSEYTLGNLMARKRILSSTGIQDENNNSSFKIPNKKSNLEDIPTFLGLNDVHEMDNKSLVCENTESFTLQSGEAMYGFCSSIQTSPMVSSSNDDNNRDTSLIQGPDVAEPSKFENHFFCHNNPDLIQAPLLVPCPEQITEEEFLSGQLFTHSNYISTQSHLENMPTLLDSQVNFTNSDFSVQDLSITGVGIRPPDWWNQSLSASQISISKLNCSLGSLVSVGNVERESPFTEDEHQVIWHSDQNLEELDILFGLS